MAGERGSQHRHGERGARAFAKPHVEIEDRPHAERGAEPAMACFRRAMGDLGMVEGALLQTRKRGGGSRGDEAVEQHGDAMAAGGEGGAEDGGEFAAAEDHARGERVCVMSLMPGEACVDHLALSRQTGIVEAGAAPCPTLAATTEQRRGERRRSGGIADSHLAEADEIGACGGTAS